MGYKRVTNLNVMIGEYSAKNRDMFVWIKIIEGYSRFLCIL